MIKILIVDDERIEREILSEIIASRFGTEAQVQLAENGRMAVAAAAEWNPELILMDIEMPGIDGIEAARQILAEKPGSKIIFVTAYGLFTYAREAINLGACDYILKPVDADYVEQAIRRVLSQIQSQRQLEATAGDDASWMDNVKEYLRQNYRSSDITPESVSSLLNIDAVQFLAQFEEAAGMSFADYLAELRVSAAKELLTDPLRSVLEVAGEAGYESDGQFLREFKKVTGMSPREYRRAGKRENSGL